MYLFLRTIYLISITFIDLSNSSDIGVLNQNMICLKKFIIILNNNILIKN